MPAIPDAAPVDPVARLVAGHIGTSVPTTDPMLMAMPNSMMIISASPAGQANHRGRRSVRALMAAQALFSGHIRVQVDSRV